MARNILVADDSLTIQKVVELTFADSDYRLTSVSNGRLALERVRLDPPDLILADVVMPEKNGYEICEEIKKDPATSHIPVILLAGTFEPFDRERAERLSCDAIVRKPFDARELHRKVDALLGGAGSAMRSRSVESLAGLYGPEDVESALAGFGEVAPVAEAAEPVEARRSTDTVVEPRITRDSLARFLDEAVRDTASEREAAAFEARARAEEDEGRTRKIDVSGFSMSDEIRRDNFFVPDPSEAAAASVSSAAEPPPEEPLPPLPVVTAAPAATSPIAAAPPPSAAVGSRELTDAEVDRIAERLAQKVVEKLSDRVVREVAWEVVPDTAELVVRERIRELESGVE